MLFTLTCFTFILFHKLKFRFLQNKMDTWLKFGLIDKKTYFEYDYNSLYAQFYFVVKLLDKEKHPNIYDAKFSRIIKLIRVGEYLLPLLTILTFSLTLYLKSTEING